MTPGEVVSYSYNAQMALKTVSGQDQSSHTYLANASYDVAGRVVERRLGQGGNLSMRYSYYPWTQQGGRLQQLAAGPLANPSALLDLRYSYNMYTGNLTTIQDYRLGSPQTQTFQYDDLDRLTQAGASGGTVGNYGPETYAYDSTSGNLASSNGTAYFYNDPAHVHAVTNLSNGDHFGYDSNGNMTSRTVGGQSFSLSYDAENRMVGVSWTISGTAHSAAFLYNDDGRRIVSTIDGTTTVFVGDTFEWHENVASSIKYYYAGSVRLAMRTGSGEPLFLLGDHLGSTSVVADGNGQQVAGSPQAYRAWGETRAGNVPTGYRFTGQFSNEVEFGLYYFNARWYDSGLKRWASPDSIVPEASQGVQAWDRYAFVNNNPIRWNDPSGHCAGPLVVVCIALIEYGPLILETAGIILFTAAAANLNQQANNSTTINGQEVKQNIIFMAPGIVLPSVGADSLSDDALVFQFQKNMAKPGKAPTFTNSPRPGEAAISTQYGPAINNNPVDGLANAFNRTPRVNEYYRVTTIGQIRNAGRIPDYDAGTPIPFSNEFYPPGHLSIYGESSPELFDRIWSSPIPFGY